MERMINFEQFYYTNYGQGMRFEGDSSHNRQTERQLELLTAGWMRLDTLKPVEIMIYHSGLGSYVAAMVVSCTKEGDARTSYWIHAVMPDNRDSDGFRECLSWPLASYQTEVLTGQELSVVEVERNPIPPGEACRRYQLTGSRLVQLMYMVWQTVCGRGQPSTLVFILDASSAADYNEAARTVMSLVYDILPEQRKNQADYQAWSEGDIDYLRFVFKRDSASSWQFCLDPSDERIRIDIPAAERQVLEVLADIYEKKPEQYRALIKILYTSETDCFEEMIGRYYLECVKRGIEFHLPQEVLIQNISELEKRAVDNEDCRRLFCYCLHQVDTAQKPVSFVRTVLEKYILAAASLKDRNSREYIESLIRNWQLLDQMRAGNQATAQSYLEWIRKISVSYYQDFVENGLSEGRTWILDIIGCTDFHTSKELFEWIEQTDFLKKNKDYCSMVSDKAEELYSRETATETEKRQLLPYCRNLQEAQLQALTRMSFDELLQLEQESMEDETQNLWIKTMAKRVEEKGGRLDSVGEARKLYEYLTGMHTVMYQLQRSDRDGENPETIDPADMGTILSAVWKYEARLDLGSRLTVCLLARYTSDLDTEEMSREFWMRVRPEDYEELYASGGLLKVFGKCDHPNYNNYRLYHTYRKREQKPYNGLWKKSESENLTARIRRLRGDVRPAVTAIWQYWQNHEEADADLMHDMLLEMMEEDALQSLLEKYAGQGRVQAQRVQKFVGEIEDESLLENPDEAFKEETEETGGQQAETDSEKDRNRQHKKWAKKDPEYAVKIVPWIMTACIGLYMGLMVNGWYMAVHLSKLLDIPALVWCGIAGMALLTAVFMAFADRLVMEEVKVKLVQIPWAGLWLLINLVLSYFIGNKITALISGVVLLAAYIWLRMKKHL